MTDIFDILGPVIAGPSSTHTAGPSSAHTAGACGVLPAELRETALGGLAATPFGRSVKERMERGEF